MAVVRTNRRKCQPVHPFVRIGCVLSVILLSACAGSKPSPSAKPGQPRPYRVNGAWYQPLEHSRDYSEQGRASWYGEDFHGRPTSSGEVYDMHALTAAHKTLPLGTYVRVFNLDNGTSVDVRVNDRGPFVRGRIIDLSYAAAKAIRMVGPGTARVRIQALGAPVPDSSTPNKSVKIDYLPIDYYSGKFCFQVGAFTEKANADRMLHRLDPHYPNAHITTFYDGSRTFYRVRVGLATTLEEAERFEQRLSRNGFPNTFIVAE